MAAKGSKPARTPCADAAVHVDWNESLDRWDVVDHDGQIVGHFHHKGDAVSMAIREAQKGFAHGDDVIVCVEQPDGHYLVAWSAN